MLKIELEKFFPVEGDADFCITLRPLSFTAFQEALIASTKDAPSGGPMAETEHSKLSGNHEFVRKVCQHSIVKVSGMELDGKPVLTWQEFLDAAPAQIVDRVMKRAVEISKMKEDERKNS